MSESGDRKKATLLDAAERRFAATGFAGTSVRRITEEAGADLGSIRYHFGSKLGLYKAMVARRLVPMNEDRRARLEALETAGGDAAPALEDILEAFVRPAVDVVLDPAHGAAWRRIIGWARVEPQPMADVPELYGDVLSRYVEACRRALPNRDPDEVAHALFFFFGAQVNTLIDTTSLPAIADGLPDIDHDPSAVVARLIRFGAAGMRSAPPREGAPP